MNYPTTMLLPGPSPPPLLLAQFCSTSLPASSLDPKFLALNVTTITILLQDMLDPRSYQRPVPEAPAPARALKNFQDDPAERGYRHGGLND